MRKAAWLRASRARVGGALAACAGLLGACNILTGLDKDYVLGNVGPTGEGGLPEGSTGDSGADAATDAPIGPDGGDASALSFCEALRRHPSSADSGSDDFFCDDFEDATWQPNGAVSGWTKMNDAGPATILLLTDGGTDGGRGAFYIDSNPGTSSSRQIRLERRFSGARPASDYLAYEIDFDFRFESMGLQYQAVGLLAFSDDSDSTKEHGVAAYGPTTPELSRESTPGTHVDVPILDGWHHARIELQRSAVDASYTRQIKIDGVSVDLPPTSRTLTPLLPTYLRIGVFNTSTTVGRVAVAYDNVVFRRR